ncbi:hypothetical protein DACRYDRAFT_114846 [Dacryopinax primogenitus]|uniref:Uncharacterized protein n=1 Tax=Dacryopinax primogenitus (strain DJM 731) TaxID=1858805 RepID=M5FZH9_DACPD|nr:uncharacterized protein DACRYDRAFT_114846 [Dacryopinax primogenitus]EJU03441.1 hypothetical protein DACRYDRAFT_114846 [Dacryopinax primogenitus]
MFPYNTIAALLATKTPTQFVAALPPGIYNFNREAPAFARFAQHTCIVVKWACLQPVLHYFSNLAKNLTQVLENHVLIKYGRQTMPVVREIYVSSDFPSTLDGPSQFRKYMALVHISLDSVAILIDNLSWKEFIFAANENEYLRLVWHEPDMRMKLTEAILSKSEEQCLLAARTRENGASRQPVTMPKNLSFTPIEQGAIFTLANLQHNQDLSSIKAPVSSPSPAAPMATAAPVSLSMEPPGHSQSRPPAPFTSVPSHLATPQVQAIPSITILPSTEERKSHEAPCDPFFLRRHLAPIVEKGATQVIHAAPHHATNTTIPEPNTTSQSFTWPKTSTSQPSGLLVRTSHPYFDQSASSNNGQVSNPAGVGQAPSNPGSDYANVASHNTSAHHSHLMDTSSFHPGQSEQLPARMSPQDLGQSSRNHPEQASVPQVPFSSGVTGSTAQPAAFTSHNVRPTESGINESKEHQPVPVKATNASTRVSQEFYPLPQSMSDVPMVIPSAADFEMYITSLVQPMIEKITSTETRQRPPNGYIRRPPPRYPTFASFDEVEGENNLRYRSPSVMQHALPRHTTPVYVRCMSVSQAGASGGPLETISENCTERTSSKKARTNEPELIAEELDETESVETLETEMDIDEVPGGSASCPVDLTGDDD